MAALNYKKFNLRPKKKFHTVQQLLLLLSGTVEINPGPTFRDLCSKRGIKLLHQNIRGLFGKRDIVQSSFTSDKSKLIITLSETHIVQTDNSDLFKMSGFKIVHKDRNCGPGGGVTFYISDDIKWKRRTDLETEEIECIWIEIEIFKGKNFLVGCMYRPPDSSNYLYKDFNKLLNEMLSKVN